MLPLVLRHVARGTTVSSRCSCAVVRQKAPLSSVSRLSDVIKREVNHDLRHGSSEKPSELKELQELVEKQFAVTDSVGEAVVKLSTRPGAAVQVEVEFDSRDGVEEDEVYDEPAGEEEGEDGGDLAVPFVATIVKGAETLRFRCTAADNIDISSVEFVADGAEGNDDTYVAPAYDELDEEVNIGCPPFGRIFQTPPQSPLTDELVCHTM